MSQADALKRLEALEAQARVAQLEQSRHDPEFRAQAAAYAERFHLDVDEVIAESLEIARHIAEVGEDAWDAERLAEDHAAADRLGMTLEQFRTIDWDAEYQEWVADGAVPGAWCGRDWTTRTR
jgi:hypothetical protein